MTISGAIGQGGWFYDATSANDVRRALDGVTASTIRIKLNSGGGDAFDGIEIYNYLKDHSAHVIVEVTALAASAASIIAMGADEIIMRTGSNLMIHEAATFGYGTKKRYSKKTMNALETIDESIVSIYKQRTGLSSEEIRNMIEAETWLTAEEALEKRVCRFD
ncbi:Clp protease ClpP [Peribacillus frigoritolerans]|nr:Clp protease ClpP [Peribacillus frigoritolerans]